MIKLAPPLHPQVSNRNVEFVLPLPSDIENSRLSIEEVQAIGAALQTMLPPGDIDGGRFVIKNDQPSAWYVVALADQCDRRP